MNIGLLDVLKNAACALEAHYSPDEPFLKEIEAVIAELEKGEFEPTTATEAYLQQKLLESLAREEKLREAVAASQVRESILKSCLQRIVDDACQWDTNYPSYIDAALALPKDNTVLQSHDKEVRKEAFMQAAEWFGSQLKSTCAVEDNWIVNNLRRMAEETK